MTLDEAIAEQEEFLQDNPHVKDLPWGKGMRLGIEALKKWKLLREGRAGIIDPLLPGETAEMPKSLTDPEFHLGSPVKEK